MGKLYLKTYQWVLRAVVELLDLFPPRRIDKNEFALRKGRLPEDFKAPDEGMIWVHGASLGEVITLRPFLKELADIYGRQSLVCTATTMDGLRQLQKDEICGFATLLPIELPAFTVPFIERIRPRVMLISETEIWPLLLDTLARKGVPYGIINGRINEKSVRMMRLAWPIFESAVSGMAFAFPQEKQYQRRFRILGIKDERQQQLGCFKYDIAESIPDPVALRQQYGISDGRQLICFGSTHPGEEGLILDALEPLWERMAATVIIAPRHVKRVHEVEELLRARKIEFIKVSEGASSSAAVASARSQESLQFRSGGPSQLAKPSIRSTARAPPECHAAAMADSVPRLAAVRVEALIPNIMGVPEPVELTASGQARPGGGGVTSQTL